MGSDGEETVFEMRYYSFVDENAAELGAIFAPTIQVTFAESEKPADDSVVRLCLSYRFAETTAGVATDASAVESVCFFTATSWLEQDWRVKWNY